MKRWLAPPLLAAMLAACSGGGGGSDGAPSTPPPVGPTYTDAVVYGSGRLDSVANPNEVNTTTQGSVTVGGQALAYTATAGHLIARKLGTDAADATMFYVAYTLNGANPATRPVTFFYNGGPGSATVWLHMGSFGPKRLDVRAPAVDTPIPFALVDNAESLLDVSDLVFVDAVGAGYSTAITPNNNQTFWGVDADAAVFRDFIRRYLAVNNRAASPKFLFGESYGGPRTAVLAALLETAGIRLTGLVLQSPAMNYNTNCGVRPAGSGCSRYLGAYAATGAWHNLTTPPVSRAQLETFAPQWRTLTNDFYAPAIVTFFATGLVPQPASLQQLTNATGYPVAGWQANFNLNPNTFRVNLRPGQTLGRYDARMMTTGSNANIDVSSSFISPSFRVRLEEYVANTLGYTTPSEYTLLGNAINTWNFSHDGQALPDTIPDLATAIALNPGLKVLAQSGYHDLATPWQITEDDLARLGANPNITVKNYAGGHMTYLDDETRITQKADLAAFYRSALP